MLAEIGYTLCVGIHRSSNTHHFSTCCTFLSTLIKMSRAVCTNVFSLLQTNIGFFFMAIYIIRKQGRKEKSNSHIETAK